LRLNFWSAGVPPATNPRRLRRHPLSKRGLFLSASPREPKRRGSRHASLAMTPVFFFALYAFFAVKSFGECGRDAHSPFFSAHSAPPRENKQGAINRAPTRPRLRVITKRAGLKPAPCVLGFASLTANLSLTPPSPPSPARGGRGFSFLRGLFA